MRNSRAHRPRLGAATAGLFVAALAVGGAACGNGGGAAAAAAAQDGKPPHLAPWPRDSADMGPTEPNAPPAALLELIGEYGSEGSPMYLFERRDTLRLIANRGAPCRLERDARDAARLVAGDGCAQQPLVVVRDARGRVASITLSGTTYPRREVGPKDGAAQLRVEPVRPVAELLKEAVTLAPPAETGSYRAPDLVEVVRLAPTIKLDVRYATTNNFLGSVFYPQARAFLQRPAAEAVVRAQGVLKPLGYGLLIHDGYRPWYVTKVFWEATPSDLKWLVANPASGSRHNRGAAVDLTLYELASGKVVEMPSTYDESTPRAYAFYPGGTELQRWHRALLRRVMEAEGFTVNPEEWWHFDYKDWRTYRIGNVPFDRIK